MGTSHCFPPLTRCGSLHDLVSEADAAVVVFDARDPTVRRIAELIEQTGIPVHVVGALAQSPKADRCR